MQARLPAAALLLAFAPCASAHAAAPAAPPNSAATVGLLRVVPRGTEERAASTSPPACRPLADGTVAVALNHALVRRLNRAGFVVSGTYPASFSAQDVLRLPVTGGSLAAGDRVATDGALFLHAGTHRLSLSNFALRTTPRRSELLVRLGAGRTVALGALAPIPCARSSATRAGIRFTARGAAALRNALGAGPALARPGARLGQLTLR
jgi:hypothetical protein